METEEQVNIVTDKIRIIHERTMSVKQLVSWRYEEEFKIQRHRHRMGGDEGIHLTIKNTEDGN